MLRQFNLITGAIIVLFGIVLFVFSIGGNPSGLLIALAVFVGAVMVWMLGLMWQNNPPEAPIVTTRTSPPKTRSR